MSDSTCFIGLDYHQGSVQVCALESDGTVISNRRVANDWHAIVGAAPSGRPIAAAIEAGTGAADLGDQLTDLAGWDVSLAHAQYVAKLKQSPDKSDFSDARLLGDLTRVGYLPRTWRPPQRTRELRRVSRHRHELADQRRAVKLRIQAIRRDHRLGRPPANPWTRRWLHWLRHHEALPESSRWLLEEHLDDLDRVQKKIARAEEKLEAMTAGDALVEQLKRLPGIGPVTAYTLAAEIGRFDRFRTAKQLCRYCGLSPRNASSGEKRADAGLIRAADPKLRALLIQAAHRLARTHRRWRAMAGQLRGRGKPATVAVAAVANRWMRWLYHQVVTNHAEPAATA